MTAIAKCDIGPLDQIELKIEELKELNRKKD
jgi:hypothetical protein